MVFKREYCFNYYNFRYKLFKNVAELNYSFRHIKKSCEAGYRSGQFILRCNGCDQINCERLVATEKE